MPKHFIKIRDLGLGGPQKLLKRALAMKKTQHRSSILDGKNLVLIFEKASTRTRLSFEVAVRHLGGQTIFMTDKESQLGRSEPLKDTARVISRYNDGIIVRTFSEEKLEQLIEYSGIPVINALTDQSHPCQVMSDLLTIYERTPDFSKLKVAWVGDGNNMAYSWIEAAMVFPFELALACPVGYEPNSGLLAEAIKSGARITAGNSPEEAVRGAHYINTDVWASMGQEDEQAEREAVFAPFQINAGLMSLAAPDAKFMHCLPAHRGEEVTEDVLESPASIIFDEAENRLHMQKAILEWCFSPGN